MYSYWKSEPNLYTVGLRHSEGIDLDDDFDTREGARARVNFLNGGLIAECQVGILENVQVLERIASALEGLERKGD